MKTTISLIILSFICSCTVNKTKQETSLSDYVPMVLSWNKNIIAVAVEEDGLLTLKGVRTAAMVHIAMHDVLNNIHPQYETYVYSKQNNGLDPIVAMSEAAFVVATTFYPDQSVRWLSEKNRWIKELINQSNFNDSLMLGAEAAESIIDSRADDRWNEETDYQWHPMAPGVYAEFNEHSGTPKGFIFGAGWADAKPFVLTSSKQFLAPAPPVIKSDEYTQAFNEVKAWGRNDSQLRTKDQTHLALWWKEFSEISHNKLARELSNQHPLDLPQTTRLFALLNMAIFDAYVNVFYNKFHYNHWRPYTAIRWADHDGNPNTVQDSDWTNTHQHTYAFPSYPSAHGTACTAAMQVMTDTFGPNLAFSMSTPEVDKAGPFSAKIKMDPPERHFDSFAEAALECSMSRLYLGIHFRYDSIEGNLLGKRIGQYVIEHKLSEL